MLLFGAPYLPTLKNQQQNALDLLKLKPGQTLLDLGCGDGRVLKAAAKQGIYGVGYEINPLLFIIAKIVTWRQRQLIKIYLVNYWQSKWPRADGIYVFLLEKYMYKLDRKIRQNCGQSLKVVSYGFQLPNKEVLKQIGALYLYEY